MTTKVHISQDCAAGCGMKVETLLKVGDRIPPARLCVNCKAKP